MCHSVCWCSPCVTVCVGVATPAVVRVSQCVLVWSLCHSVCWCGYTSSGPCVTVCVGVATPS